MVSYVRHLFQTEPLLIILMPIVQLVVLIIVLWGLYKIVKKLISLSCFIFNRLRNTTHNNKGTKDNHNQKDLIDINA